MSNDVGIFSETYARTDVTQSAAALAGAGFAITQFNWPTIGLSGLPDPANPPDYGSIGEAYRSAGVRIGAVSGTYNMIHPDPAVRRQETERCLDVIANATRMGTTVVTLCTGTRTAESMWRAHPDNQDPAAWRDLRETLEKLLPAAASAGVRLGIEPEPSNVVTDGPRAARLLDELGDDARHLTIVLDPANLLDPGALPDQESPLRWAFEELGEQMCMLHAKDVDAGGFGPPGTGELDYDLVFRLYDGLPEQVPVIIQDTTEDDVPRVREFLQRHSRRG